MTIASSYQPTADEQAMLAQAAAPVLERIRRDRDLAQGHPRAMLDYLLDHFFDQRLTVLGWQRACRLGSDAVVIIFHQIVGEPPGRYLALRRLDIARSLLAQTPLEVWKISLLVGFPAHYTLGRLFKRELGETPQHYRIRQRILAELDGDRPP